MSELAPILLFVYNRPEHTKYSLESLKNSILADKSDIFIFSDAPKKADDIDRVNSVREYLKTVNGFNNINICLRESNFGLANNIIDGVSTIISEYGKVIVIEDDLVVSPYFLKFMNDALECYKDELKVGHIHACNFFQSDNFPETFLTHFVGSWGWATWERAWKVFNPDGSSLLKEIDNKKISKEFDINGSYRFTKMLRDQVKGLNNSWAIRWYASLFLNGFYSINSGVNLVENIGLDGSGTHCGSGISFTSKLYIKEVKLKKVNIITEDLSSRKIIESYYRRTYSVKAKILRRIKRTLKGDFKS